MLREAASRPSINFEGNAVAFQSSATNLIDADPPPPPEIDQIYWVRFNPQAFQGDDQQQLECPTRIVSVDDEGMPGNSTSYEPRVSISFLWPLERSSPSDSTCPGRTRRG